MQKFENIEQIYAHLENNCLNYNYSCDIKDLFVNENDTINQNFYYFEQIIFNFYFSNEDSKVKPTLILPNGTEIPDKNNLSTEFYDYLKKRQNEVKHPFLKSYYSHLLWGLNQKRFGEDAINAYLELIGIYEKGEIKKKDLDFEICNIITHCCIIAFSINSKIKEQCKTKMLEILFNSFEKKDYYTFAPLTNFVLNNFKNFKPENIENLQSKCFLFFDNSKEDNDFEKIELLKLGEKIDQKLNLFTQNWQLEIAKVYEKMCFERQDLANITFCLKALAIYGNLEMKDEVSKLQARYKQIREEMQFSKISVKIDESDILLFFEENKKIANVINDFNTLMCLLIGDNKYFIIDTSEIDAELNFFSDTLPADIFDNNGHKSQEFIEDEELRDHKILFTYSSQLSFKSFLFTNFLELMLNKKILTINNLKDFFIEYSWFEQEIEKKVANEIHVYKWIDFINPALNSYFQELDKWIENSEYEPNFILFIDSLTPKIEGMIRNIFEFNDKNTSKFKTGQKKNLTVEKDINQLFIDDAITELIDENTLFFLKFLLTEKTGFNLRNKVAHCLMEKTDYNFQIANLLLLALIKLSKFQFQNEDTNAPN